jgi:poly(3-hydroxybutyrate) depolymerase
MIHTAQVRRYSMSNMVRRQAQAIRWQAAVLFLLAQLVGTSSLVWAQDKSLPPIVADFEAKVASESQMAGRKVVRYEHEMIKEWGYAAGAPNRPFIVVEPAKASEAPPLLVYLHSAGNEFKPSIPDKLPGFGSEFVALALHSVGGQQDGWHGWHKIKKDPKKFARTYTPVEHRLLATIEWVARKYKVDRNRIYLWGISMGGSGTLGLGLARGDIFAAAYVVVPAGVEHGWHRMGFPEITKGKTTRSEDYLARVSGVGLPDPPPLLNFSSQTDGWARGQENLIQAMHHGRHLMAFCWAPIGHTANWDATTMTAELTHFEMDLSLVDAKEISTDKKSFTVPEKSMADVTPRRLQKFKVQPGKSYTWRLLDAGNVVQSGEVRPDSVGMLTLPRLTIMAGPRTLVLEPRR